MAYKVERFHKARRLFPSLSQQQKEAREMEIFTGPTYELRDRKRKKLHNGVSSWIDDDNDEDYDPYDGETYHKRKSVPDSTSRSVMEQKSQGRSPPQTTQALQSEDTNPTSPSASGSDDNDVTDSWDKYWAIEMDSNDASSRYRLRIRKNTVEAANVDTGLEPILEQRSQSNLPFTAKGCHACQELQMPCSLLDSPFTYPCNSCRVDNIECEPDPSPTLKRTCEKCRSRRDQHCSYRSGDYDHTLPCQFCLQHGFKCVAGPSRYQPSTGLATVTDVEMIDVSATEHEYKSTPSGLDTEVAGQCLKRELNGGKEESLVSQSNTVQKLSLPTPAALNLIEPENALALAGRSFRARTCFAHPLEILTYPVQDASQPCHWCNNFAYGIVGLGPRTPEVIYDCDGRLIELQDGHTGEGKEPSRMCQFCVFQRLSIMNCNHGDIHSLPDSFSPGDDFDKSGAFDELARAVSSLIGPESQQSGPYFSIPSHPWCSLCREPAFYVCQTVPNDTRNNSEVHSHHEDDDCLDKGCGLLLCDYCAHYTKVYLGDLDAVVRWGKQDPQNGTEYRADVSYVLRKAKDNFLWRRLGYD